MTEVDKTRSRVNSTMKRLASLDWDEEDFVCGLIPANEGVWFKDPPAALRSILGSMLGVFGDFLESSACFSRLRLVRIASHKLLIDVPAKCDRAWLIACGDCVCNAADLPLPMSVVHATQLGAKVSV